MQIAEKLREKWENFQFWLEEHHIPKPVFFLILVLALIIIAYLLLQHTGVIGPEQKYNLKIRVLDKQRQPIKDAVVTVRSDFFEGMEKTTGPDGEANFEIPANKKFTLEATYSNASKSLTMQLSDDAERILMLDVEIVTYFDKRVIFYRDETQEKATEVKNFSAKCSLADWEKSATASAGEALLEKVPSNCGTLTVKIGNDIYTTRELDTKPFEIKLEGAAVRGSVVAIIKDAETGTPLAANEISATLLNEFQMTIAGPITNDASGSVSFLDVEPGRYAIKISGLGKYKDLISEYKQLKGSEQLLFTISVQKAEMVYQIKVRVVDTKGNAMKSAKLELKDLANNTIVQSKYTDDKGEYTFNVSENKAYNLIVTIGQWTRNFEVKPSDTFYDITYNASELSEAGRVIVTVKDSEGNLIENAKVELLTQEEKSSGLTCTTGADGKCNFDKVLPGIYNAKAALSNFPPVVAKFEVKPYMEAPVEVVLKIEIPKAPFEFIVSDSQGAAVAGATVSAFDLISGNLLAETTTNEKGLARLSVRTDSTPYFVIVASDYLPYVTAAMKPVFGVTTSREIKLLKEGTFKVQFDGLFIGDKTAESTLSAGTTYVAKFRLIVPSEKYRGAGIHIRTGNDVSGRTNLMEEDIAYIGRTNSAASRIMRGTSFSPPVGTASDLTSAANEMAKWTELEWVFSKMPVRRGVFEAEAEVVVKDGIADGEILKLSYRGYAYADVFDRDPKDLALGNAKDTPEKHGLYATTYDIIYSIGAANLCDGKYCKSFSIENLYSKTKTIVTDSYSADVGNAYRLNFTINKQAAGAANNLTLKILNEQRSLKFGAYSIMLPDGTQEQGTAENEISVSITAFPQNSTLAGNVQFEAVKDGKAILKIAIEGAQGTLFEHLITIDVKPGKELSMDMVPKTIVALIDNELLFRFTDKESGEAVDGVCVALYLNNTQIASGLSDYNGVFAYKLQAPESGAVLKIIAKKPGYKTFVHEVKIDTRALKVTPPSLTLDLQPDAREEAELNLSVENQTAITLSLKDISFDGLNEFIEITAVEHYRDKELKPSESLAIKLKARLTEKGKNVKATTELAATIIVSAESKELAKEWASDVELNARILLGGELDNASCLVVDPQSWTIKSYGESKKLLFTIQNNCTVQGNPTALKSLSARVKWRGESPIGVFIASGDIIGTEIELGESLTTISETFKKNAAEEITIIFTPSKDIQSASIEPVIEFSADHFSDKGKETAKATVNVSISVNNIMKCLQIVRQENIELKTCGFDTGWGLTHMYFDRDPYATAQQQQLTWPTVQYTPPWQSTYTSGDQSTSWKCEEEKAEITIDNSCSEDVEITAKTDPDLSAEPTKQTVKAGSTETLKIVPSSKIGKFNVKILGRFAGSTKKAEELDSFSIKVVRYDEIKRECLPTIEPKTLTANFLGWQKTVARIYNKCYHLGYALGQITLENFHCYSPASKGTSLEGPCPLIKSMIVGQTKIQDVSENEQWEIMEVNIWFNPEIKEFSSLDLEGSIEQQLGKIRVITTEYYTAVSSPGVISVPMYVPALGLKYFPIDVTFEDPLQWLGIVGSFMNKGSPNLEPAQCLNQDALTIPEPLGDNDFIDDIFIWNENPSPDQMVMPYARSNESVSSAEGTKEFCGKDDYIQSIGFSVWEDKKSGVKLYFELTKDRHHIVMKVDRSNMITQCAKINFYLPVKVTRVYYKAGTQEAKLRVSLSVLNRGITQLSDNCENLPYKTTIPPKWGSMEPCNSTQQYEEYGFNRLLFSWRSEDITSKTCEPEPQGEGYFCDGAQFVMQIAHKLKAINKSIEVLNSKAPPEYLAVLDTIRNNPELMKEINEGEGKFYMISKAQLVIRDDVSNGNGLFFISKEGTLLGQPTLEQQECNATSIENALTNLIASPQGDELNAIGIMESSFAEFERLLSQCYGNDIGIENALGLIDKSMDTNNDAQNIWEKYRAIVEDVHLPNMNSYVITYYEYRALHDQLLQGLASNIATKNRSQPITVNIGATSISATEAEWAKFLKAMARNTRFMLATMNKPGLSPAMEEYIRQRAADIASTSSQTEIMTSEAYLKADNLSSALVEDLDKANETFKLLNIKTDAIEFKRYEDSTFTNEIQQKMFECKVASGKYAYRIEPRFGIDFSSQTPRITVTRFVIKLALIESLEAMDKRAKTKYSENPLMYLSFEGEIGKDSTANYGLGLSISGAVPQSLLYNEHGERIYPRAPGLVKMALSYNNKFEKSRFGTVLNIDLKGKRIEYTPSYPVALKLASPSDGENVVYYKLSNENYYGNIKELFVWWKAVEDENQQDVRVDEFGLQQPESFCTWWTKSMNAAKLIVGQGAWGAVSYVPAGASEEYLKLEILCAKNPVALAAMNYNGEEDSTPQTRGPEGGAVRIDISAQPSIKSYIDMISTGEICIDRINNSQLRLRWNPSVVWQ